MKNLDGLRIVVTRAAHQAEELAGPLRERGAEVLLAAGDRHCAARGSAQRWNRRLPRWIEFDWIIFTSANAIAAFVTALGRAPGEIRRARRDGRLGHTCCCRERRIHREPHAGEVRCRSVGRKLRSGKI